MPIWLRNFTFNQIQEHYNKVNSQSNTDNVKKSIDAMKSVGAVAKPTQNKKITPATYNTKASKK